jgi:hypothetical protein
MFRPKVLVVEEVQVLLELLVEALAEMVVQEPQIIIEMVIVLELLLEYTYSLEVVEETVMQALEA